MLAVVFTAQGAGSDYLMALKSDGLPRWLSKESTSSIGEGGSIPESGRCHGERSGNPFMYSCLGIPWSEEPGGLQSMGLQKSQTQLSD